MKTLWIDEPVVHHKIKDRYLKTLAGYARWASKDDLFSPVILWDRWALEREYFIAQAFKRPVPYTGYLNLRQFVYQAPQDSESVSPEEAMFAWESKGIEKIMPCSNAFLLASLVQGKVSRDWHIREWTRGVKAKEFWPEEFLGCCGLRSVEEFRSVFGRGPSLPLLQRIHREVQLEIQTATSVI